MKWVWAGAALFGLALAALAALVTGAVDCLACGDNPGVADCEYCRPWR